jgi:hypothetical protein
MRNPNARIKLLSLRSSEINGSADAIAGLTYLEWTLSFRNDAVVVNEARAQVQLPPGAVVSRVLLLLDGRWSEPAFAERARVHDADTNVVRQQKDPLLVTTSGRDRVLIQCFPVQPHGGEMKVRLGITAPLLIESRTNERLRLPYFAERNFFIDDEFKHEVWVESNAMAQSANQNLEFERPLTSAHSLRGKLSDVELSRPESSIAFAISSFGDAWTTSTLGGQESIVRQSIREKTTTRVSRIVLVVDTSRGMKGSSHAIASAVERIPANVELHLLFSDGNGIYEQDVGEPKAGSADIASFIGHVKPGGGTDNVPALIRASELADSGPGNTAIVWIHSPQLIKFRQTETLRQRFERRPDGPRLYSVETNPGVDQVEQALDGVAAVESVPRLRPLESDLNALFGSLTQLEKTFEYVRTNEITNKVPDSSEAKETSAHLARLWANNEINRLLATNDEKAAAQATQLAVQYQLVTPVSGGVVLEDREQYAAAALRPVAAATVPTIPALVVLLGIGTAVLLLGLSWHHVFLRRRRRAKP